MILSVRENYMVSIKWRHMSHRVPTSHQKMPTPGKWWFLIVAPSVLHFLKIL